MGEYLLKLRGLGDDRYEEVRVRMALKTLLRAYSLRCESIERVEGQLLTVNSSPSEAAGVDVSLGVAK